MLGGLYMKGWTRRFQFAAIGVCLFLCAGAVASAQSPEPGTIRGSVLDQAGKAIPNASVTVKEERSGSVRRLAADADGRFSAAGLPAGSYTVEATAPGFAAN